jgi:pyocin large subunit-like protein
MRVSSWMPAVTIFIAVFVAVFALAGGEHAAPPFVERAASVQAEPGGTVWSHGADGAARNGDEHWRKHGGDFPEFRDAGEYERGAAGFVHRPPAGTRIKHRANGDTLFYDPGTNTFAVEDARGEPRTFFRPRNGEAYWRHQ